MPERIGLSTSQSPEGWGIKVVEVVDLDPRIQSVVNAMGLSAGEPGASAYEVAVSNGFSGTEAEWLASLVGPAGADGAPGADGADGDQGIQGIQGIQGPPGADGAPGANGEGIPSGVIAMWGGAVANIPSGWLLCNGANGTPDLRNRFIKGASGEPGATGGAATHAHAAHSDHAALTHTGTAVGDHTVTQPVAASESAHTHTYTQVVNHVHVQSVNSATTGGLSGYAPDTSTNNPVASGISTQNPTGGVASGTTAAGSSHTHTLSGAAVSAHSVTQPSQHAAQSHSAHDAVNHEPAFYALCFIQKQ